MDIEHGPVKERKPRYHLTNHCCTMCGGEFIPNKTDACIMIRSLRYYSDYKHKFGDPDSRTKHRWCTPCTVEFFKFVKGRRDARQGS